VGTHSFRLLPILVVLALMLSATAASAGQKELMKAWADKQQAVKQQVFERLQEENKLPENGTVFFKAKVKPDPKDQNKTLIMVDEVRVSPSPTDQDSAQGNQEPKVRPAPIRNVILEWEPMDVSGFLTYEVLDIPMQNSLEGQFMVRGGAMDEQEQAGEPVPAEP
jgi:hypothetical protein